MDDLAREIKALIEDCKAKGKRRPDPATTGRDISWFRTRDPGRGLEWETPIPDPEFSQPPRTVEKEHGFTGIAGRYHLPEDLSAEDIQTYSILVRNLAWQGDYSIEDCLGKLSELHQALVGRNPELADIRYNPQDPHAVYDIVLGVASAFNVADIQHFLNMNPESEPNYHASLRDPDWKKLHDALRARGVDPFWVPARQTLENMHLQSLQAEWRARQDNKFDFG